ncbi:MAG: ABC-type transport auxiliary lipoprotein family protein [Candidatus Igneacidithiobacillus chanchocoensis]
MKVWHLPRFFRIAVLFALGVGLAGCASAPAWQQPYALQSAAAPVAAHAAPRAGVLRLEAVAAPSWLAAPELLYRLQYADPQALYPYNNARWAAAPGQMLASLLVQRLQQQGDWRAVLGPGQAGRPELLLQLGLQNFVIDYSSAQQGEAQIACTATLLRAKDYRVLAQKSFVVHAALPKPGPAGGAAAMNAAAQQMVDQISAWAAQQSPAGA